ncbi:MAG TPA: hypothetical protein VNA89_13190 [Gemmatimonadaceae bacterium]|nr:hypothetical protein [Gemmatimonadaceae bacterium]
MSHDLRPRSATEVIDAGFQLTRGHYAELIAAPLALYVPILVLRMGLPDVLQFIPSVAWWLLGTIGWGAGVVIASDAYLLGRPDVAKAVRQAASRFWALLFGGLLQGTAVVVGFLLLIVPGFLFLGWAFAMQAVILLEGVPVLGAFDRSRYLARGHVLRILGTLLLTFLIFAGVLLVIVVAAGFLIAALFPGREGPLSVIVELVTVGLSPLFTVVTTLLYYDLRIRKEGFDLEVRAGRLGAVPTAGAPLAPDPAR